MKIEIDFDNKIIEVKDQTTIGELIDKLKELNLKDWKEYKLQVATNFYPWYIPSIFPSVTPYTPPYEVTCEMHGEELSKLLTVTN